MDKKIVAVIKLHIAAGAATPAPPLGSALGQKKVNIMKFVQDFNEATKASKGKVVPVVIYVYEDNSYSYVVKQPPMTHYVKTLAKITSGAKMPGRGDCIATVKRADVREFIKEKLPDLNCFGNIDAAVKMFEGSAKSMGVKVEE